MISEGDDRIIFFLFLAIIVAGLIKVVYQLIRTRIQRPARRRQVYTYMDDEPFTFDLAPPVTNVVSSNIQGDIGPMIYFATNDFGLNDCEYRFLYKMVGESWRAYIQKMPSLNGRDGSGGITHRLFDEQGNAYVCWDSAITSLESMQTVARTWADLVQEYIATGKRFG